MELLISISVPILSLSVVYVSLLFSFLSFAAARDFAPVFHSAFADLHLGPLLLRAYSTESRKSHSSTAVSRRKVS